MFTTHHKLTEHVTNKRTRDLSSQAMHSELDKSSKLENSSINRKGGVIHSTIMGQQVTSPIKVICYEQVLPY